MKKLFDRLTRAFFRPFAFFSKEFIQIRRQPRLILMLILGPFAVLLLFGLGYASESTPIQTILVLPEDSGLPTDPETYREQFVPPFVLHSLAPNVNAAMPLLEDEEVDAIVIFPERAADTIRSGQQATIEMLYNELDPFRRSWLDYYAYVQTSELNRQILLQALQQQQQGVNEGNPAAAVGLAQLFADTRSIPPEVLVSPFTPVGQNIAPSSPDYVGFYAPGVLALLIQHISVTFTALALVRERLRGAVEVFRIAPVTSREILIGKYLSYLVQTGILAAVLSAIMWLVLDVPFLGSIENFAIVLALLIAASLSLGFLISAVSNSETQAVQLSLIVLLASVFFSGFFLPLNNLIKPVWVVSYSLPVTYGVQALQDLMLRGNPPADWIILALAAMAIGFLLLTAIIFQMGFRRR